MTKISKNELKRNELEEWIRLTGYYCKNNYKVLIITITSIIFIVVAGSSILYMKRRNNKISSEMLSEALHSYHLNDNNPNNKSKIQIIDSRTILKNLIKKYPSTQSAILAYYYLGKLNYQLGDLKQSLENYQYFVDIYSNHELIYPVKINIAYIYELQNNYEEAVEIYENMINAPSVNQDQKKDIKFNLARIYELQNQSMKAKEIYSELSDNDEAQFRLSCLSDK